MGITGSGLSRKNDYFHIRYYHEYSRMVVVSLLISVLCLYIGKVKCRNKNARQCIIGEEMMPPRSWGSLSHRLRDPQGHCLLKGILYLISPLLGSKHV